MKRIIILTLVTFLVVAITFAQNAKRGGRLIPVESSLENMTSPKGDKFTKKHIKIAYLYRLDGYKIVTEMVRLLKLEGEVVGKPLYVLIFHINQNDKDITGYIDTKELDGVLEFLKEMYEKYMTQTIIEDKTIQSTTDSKLTFTYVNDHLTGTNVLVLQPSPDSNISFYFDKEQILDLYNIIKKAKTMIDDNY